MEPLAPEPVVADAARAVARRDVARLLARATGLRKAVRLAGRTRATRRDTEPDPGGVRHGAPH